MHKEAEELTEAAHKLTIQCMDIAELMHNTTEWIDAAVVALEEGYIGRAWYLLRLAQGAEQGFELLEQAREMDTEL